jgi:hypothetical protein
MPNLGEFLGQLAAAVTCARMQADLESIRVADLYANHSYLKHFAVPRFRLPNVEITIPALIDEVGEVEEKHSPKGIISIPDIQEETVRAVKSQIEKHDVRLNDRALASLKKKLNDGVQNIRNIEKMAADIIKVSQKVTEIAVAELNKIPAIKRIDAAKWAPLIARSLRLALINRRKSADLIRVSVETGKVKATASPETLTQIKLTMTEDAMEWTMIEGDEPDRLVPE